MVAKSRLQRWTPAFIAALIPFSVPCAANPVDASPQRVPYPSPRSYYEMKADLAIEENVRIRRHLEEVEEILRARDPAEFPGPLLRNRMENLDRLREYRERGAFPHNRDYPGEMVPHFIDSGGQACAVAHLMIKSGDCDLALEIARTANHDYLPDIRHPGLAAWFARSGLTAEECAMIQPGYGRYWPHRFITTGLDACPPRAGGPVMVYINMHDTGFFGVLYRPYRELITGPFDSRNVTTDPAARVENLSAEPEEGPTGVQITWDLPDLRSGVSYTIDLDSGELQFRAFGQNLREVLVTGDSSLSIGGEAASSFEPLLQSESFDSALAIGGDCAGTAVENPLPGTFVLRAHGKPFKEEFIDFRFHSDQFIFVYREVYGDFSLQATIAEGSSTLGTRGLMVRSSCHRQSPYLILRERGTDQELGYTGRPYSVTGISDPDRSSPPKEILDVPLAGFSGRDFRTYRLERSGGNLAAYGFDEEGKYGDPGKWIEVMRNPYPFSIPHRVLVGIAASSHQGCAALAEVAFEGCELESAPPPPLFRRGDATADGFVDISDAVRVLLFLFDAGAPPSCHDACDADDSGGIDISDAIGILYWLFIGDSPLARFDPGRCARDATPARPSLFPLCVYPESACR